MFCHSMIMKIHEVRLVIDLGAALPQGLTRVTRHEVRLVIDLGAALPQGLTRVTGRVISLSPETSAGLELLLGPPKRRGTRRVGDGESTRRACAIAPTAAAAHYGLAPHYPLCGRSPYN
jgi:hypothetical protein